MFNSFPEEAQQKQMFQDVPNYPNVLNYRDGFRLFSVLSSTLLHLYFTFIFLDLQLLPSEFEVVLLDVAS